MYILTNSNQSLVLLVSLSYNGMTMNAKQKPAKMVYL